jgi:Flp pilus assembly protein TadD
MDCLRIAFVALAALVGLAGCQHSNSAMSGNAPPTTTAPLPGSSYAPSTVTLKHKEKDAPPKPQVLVAAGQLLAGEAAAEDQSPQRQAQLREQARLQYEKAIKIDPKHIDAYIELARLQVAVQDRQQAKSTYQKAIKIAPRNPTAWYELGVCHNYDQEWQQAVHCLREASRLDPKRREYLNAMAVVLSRLGRYDDSLMIFQQTSSEAEAHYRLSRTLQHLNQPELSRLHLQMALQKDPQLGPARDMLAELTPPAAPAANPDTVLRQQEPVQQAGGTQPAPSSAPTEGVVQPVALSATASDPAAPPAAPPPAPLPDLRVNPSSLPASDPATDSVKDRPSCRRRSLALPPMPSVRDASGETAEGK